MGIEEVANIIHAIAEGFEPACERCLHENGERVRLLVLEQLIAGQDREGKHITPTYDDDPFFEQEGFWHKRNAAYKAWKRTIAPITGGGEVLGLSPRPDAVPNLFIDGTFYSEVNARNIPNGVTIDPGTGNGPEIVAKYEGAGHDILNMGPTAIEYFNQNIMLPAIGDFFKSCGYR